ncbi:hypothetical protein BK007_03940 [Methanobacterium subterraneum]|uniref:PIN like domain-containing protein n=1 Tax=Methanobacterium subterraneum TaxID=59277 RepID=A0A2H4VAY8_9EURY|nr:PIN-like domain-containing protein [Methanobacterium subterraneum]AUB55248.1 hypothetical protein BK007_03940 [Methanobacterium subterraneum]
MRNKFYEFSYKPDLEKLWQECVFVFDANILLDLYYNKKVYINFISILENKIPDRIWMPYQVGLEYHINRVDGVKKTSGDYNNFTNGIKGLKGIKKTFKKLSEDHSIDLSKYMDINEISENLNDIENISNELTSKVNETPDFLTDDIIMNKLHEIFEGKTGKQYSNTELNEIYDQGKIRNENKIPPSFKDKGYGDLVLWKQIIDHALENKKPIILVTGDSKKDWWLTSNKDPLCPHPTLIKEFLETVKKDFYMYKLSDFLRESKTYLGTEIENKTIEIAEGIEIMRESTDVLASIDPEYLQQLAESQRRMTEAAMSINFPPLYQQIAESQRRMTEAAMSINFPPLYQQIAESQRRMTEAAMSINIPHIIPKQLSKGQKPQADSEDETDEQNGELENKKHN